MSKEVPPRNAGQLGLLEEGAKSKLLKAEEALPPLLIAGQRHVVRVRGDGAKFKLLKEGEALPPFLITGQLHVVRVRGDGAVVLVREALRAAVPIELRTEGRRRGFPLRGRRGWLLLPRC